MWIRRYHVQKLIWCETVAATTIFVEHRYSNDIFNFMIIQIMCFSPIRTPHTTHTNSTAYSGVFHDSLVLPGLWDIHHSVRCHAFLTFLRMQKFTRNLLWHRENPKLFWELNWTRWWLSRRRMNPPEHYMSVVVVIVLNGRNEFHTMGQRNSVYVRLPEALRMWWSYTSSSLEVAQCLCWKRSRTIHLNVDNVPAQLTSTQPFDEHSFENWLR